MSKQSNKPSPSLGSLHQSSIKTSYQQPKPAKGFPSSMGSQGPVNIMHPHDVTPKEKGK